MSTTVTYKGSTLTTVDNQTRTLKTAGKYMEGDVILTDVSSSGGYVTQDQDGFIVLPATGEGGGGSGGGLEYEEGTWIPSEDVSSGIIYFSNTHTVAPFYFAAWDATGTYSDVTNTAMGCYYFNGHQIFGEPLYISSSSYRYADVKNTYRGTNATSLTSGTQSVAHSYTEGDTDMSYSRFWATESHINVKIANSTYWRAGRTYKWIAVWAPTT